MIEPVASRAVSLISVSRCWLLEAIESRIEGYKAKLDDIKERLDSGDFHSVSDDRMVPPGVEFRDYKRFISSTRFKLDVAFRSLKTISFLLVDVGPPLVFAVFAIKKTKALSHISALLSLS
ncbi:hypothetical protein [Ochrobactrum sp. BTU1]|uniref:hypothetical protein n=1 Tax=Ochrobactrum sp. BTU1 TaxID=2840456 RepID=UPI001C041D91|nr:hypothetical protein KMS41_14160 [Ochrobactrum sp. BTU1]